MFSSHDQCLPPESFHVWIVPDVSSSLRVAPGYSVCLVRGGVCVLPQRLRGAVLRQHDAHPPTLQTLQQHPARHSLCVQRHLQARRTHRRCVCEPLFSRLIRPAAVYPDSSLLSVTVEVVQNTSTEFQGFLIQARSRQAGGTIE